MSYQPLPRLSNKENIISWANQLVQELERIINNLRQIHSGSFKDKESFTGYYINGKPIYRKCVEFDANFLLIDQTTIPHNINNISAIVTSHAHYEDNNIFYPLGNNVSFHITDTDFVSDVINIIPLVNFIRGCIIIEYTR